MDRGIGDARLPSLRECFEFMTGIFINYRTGDGNDFAAFLDATLVGEFGRDNVFLDSTQLPPGEPFDPELERRLLLSTVLLVLIGGAWLTLADEDGTRLIDRPGNDEHPGDYVRWEIETSLRRGITVLPILLNNAILPGAEDLPDSIKPLCKQQYMTLRSRYYEGDIEQLVKVLRKHIPRLPTGGEPAAGGASHQYTTHVNRGPVNNGPNGTAIYNELPESRT